MKKLFAIVLVVVMMLMLSVPAFAAGGKLSLDQAKQIALNHVGVKASEATFTKAHQDWDDGRQVYEIEFFVNGTEYDMDVDANTGAITDFSVDYHEGYDRDWDDAFDRYDDWYDWDD